jgi:cyanophycinase
LTDHTAEVFSAFVQAAGGPGKDFAVLPSASSVPEESFAAVRGHLTGLGVPADAVHLLRASCRMPGWEGGAEDPELVALLEGCDGIWMLGGDQNQIMRCLVRSDGSDSLLLAALRRRLAAGAVIGGTSAGAAVMCNPMIGGGTSFGALCLPRASRAGHTEISDALLVSPGLGFFPGGVVDQHFDARSRLGRLIEAAMVEDGARRPSFGVAEDSAMLWQAASSTVTAIGAGGVYIADVRKARRQLVHGQSRILGVALHYLADGDSWNLESGEFCFADKQLLLPDDAYYAVPQPEASGVLSGYGQLRDFIACFLLDNRPDCLFHVAGQATAPEAGQEASLDSSIGTSGNSGRTGGYVRSYLIGMKDGKRLAWEIRFHRDPWRTQAWIGKGTSFRDVLMDILPVRLHIEEFPEQANMVR